MERRWRALAAFALVSGGLAVLSILIAGVELNLALLARLQDLNSVVLISRINLTLDSVLLQISNWMNQEAGWAFFHYWHQAKPAWLSWASKLFLIFGLLAAYLATNTQPIGHRIWFRLQLVFLLTLLASPLAWVHYLFLTLLLLPGLLVVAPIRFAVLYLLTFLLLFSTELYLMLYLNTFAGNLFLFGGFIMVSILIAILLWLPRKGGAETRSKNRCSQGATD